ncbi:MAG: Trm112 family protein [Pelobacteraceae bacterium]
MDTMLPLELLQILACPICKGELAQSEDGSSLHCTPCNRDYPVIDGIPVLLKEQSGAIQTKHDR